MPGMLFVQLFSVKNKSGPARRGRIASELIVRTDPRSGARYQLGGRRKRCNRNEEKGMRYCIWLSPDENELKKIFDEMKVSYETILPVVETVPDMWGDQWQEHLKKEQSADTLGNL